jgi:hypothetical protein
MCFDVIEKLDWTEESFRNVMRLNFGCLGRKAALALKLRKSDATVDLITLCENSYKALDVLFDHLMRVNPSDFLAAAPVILRKSYHDTRDAIFTLSTAIASQGRRAARSLGGARMPRWFVRGRKLLGTPYVRYARAAMPTWGKEKVFEFLSGHLPALNRSIRFVIDVLGDPKEGGLDAKDFEGIFETMKIVADLKPPFDRELLKRFADILQNSDVSVSDPFPGWQELIELVLKSVDTES